MISEYFSSTPTDVKHILRAVCGLYLSISFFWAKSAITGKQVNEAVLSAGLFTSGLGIGRLVSVLVDGVPSTILVVYLLMEIAIAPIVYYLLKK